MDKQQNQQLLAPGDDESEYDETPNLRAKDYKEGGGAVRKRKLLQLFPWVLHAVILLSYSVLILVGSRTLSSSQQKSWPEIYDGLELSEQVQKTTEHTEFEGRPTSKTDQAWHQMLGVGIVSITEEERSRLPFGTAANVFRGNEYVVELAVFHQLHCLHGLRHQLWNPHYIPWTNDEPVGWWEFHMNHCIEYLRQSLICQADITPQRFSWDEKHYSYSLDQEQQFQCRNWEEIWRWAEVRNTTGDSPMNLKGLERDGKKLDAGEIWEEETSRKAGQRKSPTK